MSDIITTAYSAALSAMQRTGPRALHQLAAVLGDDSLADGTALLTYLRDAGPDDGLRHQFAYALAGWDYTTTADAWTAGTEHNTAERRKAISTALAIDPATEELFADLFPFATADTATVIADDWEEWRTPERRAEHNFYWAHYERYLLNKGWDPDAVAGVDAATEEVIRRLSDPTRTMAYQAKGLVVGYVQSGKTANFTGVAAKAIDAGYRLVIVLTGTTNMLRAQTQRRMDMELCGRENLELEISEHDIHAHDYHTDPDWADDKFLRHGGRPSDSGYPDIIRLSNHAGDYKLLKQGAPALRFEQRERNRRFFDPVNLYTSNARLIVAKKNSTVLKGLVADLGRIKDRLGEIPVLIIDDESDQASVNTVSRKKWEEEGKERTAINRHIGTLLRMLPRAQYVGYTATPYANVFIDPSDDQDIFPRDFLVALPRPTGYMGAEDFHDLDGDTETPIDQRPLETSNERAYVRYLREEPDDAELQTALDMFVLTGAVKVHRERHGSPKYRHHTMLVHEAMGRDAHRDAAEIITGMWKKGHYYQPEGLRRLRALYEKEILPVSRARATDLPTPGNFDDLRDDLAEAIRRITPVDGSTSPVIVVNSDKELENKQESLDFDKRSIWRILVGGNKLARGFTVEGLTVTYYRRATKQVDTLMQMGRWFGFRPGYRDLVRLYTTEDLHAMFAAAYRDEAYLRTELRRYAAPAAGAAQLTPRQIPPLIAQHRPDLKPTSPNKMWNARLVEKSSPGEPMEPVAYPTRVSDMKANAELWRPLLAVATQSARFQVPGARTTYEALVTVTDHRSMLAVLSKLTWLNTDTLQPELAWLGSLSPQQLQNWVVIFPYQTRSTTRRTLFGYGPFSMFERRRTTTGSMSVLSESRHRNAAYRIAGVPTKHPDPAADNLHSAATAAIIVYPAINPGTLEGKAGDPIDPGKVTLGFNIITPYSSAPTSGRLIKWTAKDSNRHVVVVDPE
ncbi:Z1 domain-containing protein [Luedemannella helvata]|uniref:Putative endonuclease Z1 domain-containing protein n=1 Tax=Luedemannella helvata TaxID=349315 RepID=A0ABN2L3W3_9ACTN